jgi:tetratricopeptide (TPR) repeat protein
MNRSIRRVLGALAVLAGLAAARPALAQYREYYFYGTVVDTAKAPLADVEIKLRDVATSRGYSCKTNKNGEYKLAGLPHGIYKVTFLKEGFALKEDEWRFAEPQDSMQKVEIPTMTLVAQEIIEKNKELMLTQAELKAAADKIKDKDYDGAIAQLKAFLEKNPDDSNALYFLGIGYARKKMFSEALQALTRVSELVPGFGPVYFELGVCYQQLGEKDKAVEAYRKNLELDPANVDSAYNSGLILFGLGRVEEARGLFDKAMALKPEDPDILEMAGRCAINAGEFAKAVEYLEKSKTHVQDPEKIKFLADLIATLKERIKGGL